MSTTINKTISKENLEYFNDSEVLDSFNNINSEMEEFKRNYRQTIPYKTIKTLVD